MTSVERRHPRQHTLTHAHTHNRALLSPCCGAMFLCSLIIYSKLKPISLCVSEFSAYTDTQFTTIHIIPSDATRRTHRYRTHTRSYDYYILCYELFCVAWRLQLKRAQAGAARMLQVFNHTRSMRSQTWQNTILPHSL